MPVPDWKQRLRDLLCELYKLLGGDCAELGTTPDEQITTVDTAYDNGTPPQSDWANANDLLDQIVLLKAEPANPLSTSTDQSLTDLVIDIRAKVTT